MLCYGSVSWDVLKSITVTLVHITVAMSQTMLEIMTSQSPLHLLTLVFFSEWDTLHIDIQYGY